MEESPCQKLCTLNTDNICIGCGRTREEISTWTTMTDNDRIHVKIQANQRLEILKAKDYGSIKAN